MVRIPSPAPIKPPLFEVGGYFISSFNKRIANKTTETSFYSARDGFAVILSKRE